MCCLHYLFPRDLPACKSLGMRGTSARERLASLKPHTINLLLEWQWCYFIKATNKKVCQYELKYATLSPTCVFAVQIASRDSSQAIHKEMWATRVNKQKIFGQRNFSKFYFRATINYKNMNAYNMLLFYFFQRFGKVIQNIKPSF